jgi:diguanylate cyclase (GGDEF)-like protein
MSNLQEKLNRILIVNDLPANLKFLTDALKKYGFEVRCAPNGYLGLQTIPRFQPNLILLDILMPVIDGYQVCSHIKQNPETKEIPIIFLTELEDSWNKVKAFELGAGDYINKPFQVEEVIIRIKHQLETQQLQQQLQKQNQYLRQEVIARKKVELALQAANDKLEYLANYDELTQVANRRYFIERLQQEWLSLQRQQLPLSLILCDVDYFKPYNDHYGHPEGDRCLQNVAQILDQGIKRQSDLVARYGGEEFVIMLPQTDLMGAQQVVTHIQSLLKSANLPHEYSQVENRITLSYGIASEIPRPHLQPEALIKRADDALYQAKRNGRNCAIVL